MLILFVTVAVLGAVSLELATRSFRDNYQIEWVPLKGQSAGEMTREIARTLRESHDRIAKKPSGCTGYGAQRQQI
jgi:hypothetical protein